MKKILVAILAISLALSMTACGDDKPTSTPAPPTSSSAEPSKPASPEGSTGSAANLQYTPEQQAIAQKVIDTATRHDALVDKVNADPNLAEMQEVVASMNEIVAAMTEINTAFADPANLTADVLAIIDTLVVDCNLLHDEIEAMLANYGGKKTVTIPVEITNDTGVEIFGLAMSPADDTNWGGNMLDSTLATGTSGTTQMTFTEDTLVWDLLAIDSEDNELTFMGLDFSDIPTTGGKLLLTATEGGDYMAIFQ